MVNLITKIKVKYKRAFSTYLGSSYKSWCFWMDSRFHCFVFDSVDFLETKSTFQSASSMSWSDYCLGALPTLPASLSPLASWPATDDCLDFWAELSNSYFTLGFSDWFLTLKCSLRVLTSLYGSFTTLVGFFIACHYLRFWMAGCSWPSLFGDQLPRLNGPI